MTTELRQARRKLARLYTRLELARSQCGLAMPRYSREAKAMVREYRRAIAAHELECRRLALTGPWEVSCYGYGDKWARNECNDGQVRMVYGRNAKARAVKWAEKQNRGEG